VPVVTVLVTSPFSFLNLVEILRRPAILSDQRPWTPPEEVVRAKGEPEEMGRHRLRTKSGTRARVAATAAIMAAGLAATAGPALAATTAPSTSLPAVSPSSVTGEGVAVQALRHALTQQGKPYVWGAAGPNAYDCSGLVQWAYKQVGVSLPHNAAMQSVLGKPVARADLRPGDLVFFYTPVSHVGIYVGDGKILNAATTGQPVKISSMQYLPFHNARRL
jgi:peptidoglycan DL-endopeptidase CwlO